MQKLGEMFPPERFLASAQETDSRMFGRSAPRGFETDARERFAYVATEIAVAGHAAIAAYTACSGESGGGLMAAGVA